LMEFLLELAPKATILGIAYFFYEDRHCVLHESDKDY